MQLSALIISGIYHDRSWFSSDASGSRHKAWSRHDLRLKGYQYIITTRHAFFVTHRASAWYDRDGSWQSQTFVTSDVMTHFRKGTSSRSWSSARVATSKFGIPCNRWHYGWNPCLPCIKKIKNVQKTCLLLNDFLAKTFIFWKICQKMQNRYSDEIEGFFYFSAPFSVIFS